MERAPKRRRLSLKKLYADLERAPANVASLKLTQDGFEATFFPRATASEAKTAPAQASPPKLVHGTPFPDDGSPLNPIDLVFFPPQEKADA